MTTRTRSVAMIAATAIFCAAVAASPASAQAYYARQQIQTTSQASQGTTASWNVGPWSAFSSGCSASATQTRSVLCAKADGSPAPDASCSATKPESTRSEARYDGCTYSATFGAYTACAQDSQTASIASCTRSDGTPMPLSACPNQTDRRPCTVIQATCPSLSSSRWFQGGTPIALGKVTTRGAARTLCEQHIAGTSKKGVCAWESSTPNGNPTESRNAYFVEGASTYDPGTRTETFIPYAAMCQ